VAAFGSGAGLAFLAVAVLTAVTEPPRDRTPSPEPVL
jgi:hypothetical protein